MMAKAPSMMAATPADFITSLLWHHDRGKLTHIRFRGRRRA
jgi:hypothetical protein